MERGKKGGREREREREKGRKGGRQGGGGGGGGGGEGGRESVDIQVRDGQLKSIGCALVGVKCDLTAGHKLQRGREEGGRDGGSVYVNQ